LVIETAVRTHAPTHATRRRSETPRVQQPILAELRLDRRRICPKDGKMP